MNDEVAIMPIADAPSAPSKPIPAYRGKRALCEAGQYKAAAERGQAQSEGDTGAGARVELPSKWRAQSVAGHVEDVGAGERGSGPAKLGR